MQTGNMVMQKIRCMVVDDEPIARQGLIKMLEQFPGLEVCGEANCIDDWVSGNESLCPDLVFMDIMLRENNILDFLPTEMMKPLLIITTAYPQYALRGYENCALDYLLKPIAPADLERSILKAERFLAPQNVEKSKDIFIRSNGKFYRLFFHEILFVEGMENYIIIHAENHKLTVKATMAWMEAQLPQNTFLRVHRSWIVNKDRIEVLDKRNLIIKDKTIPISRENKNRIYDIILQRGKDSATVA